MDNDCLLCNNITYSPAAYDELCSSCRSGLLWGYETSSDYAKEVIIVDY